MKAQVLNVFVIVGLAGSAIGGESPTKVDASAGQVEHVAHIYFNIVTGEKITTLMQDGLQSPADGEAGSEIWVMGDMAGCSGDGGGFFYAIDSFSTTTGGAFISNTENWLFDWADISMDTVVDCVQIHWITNHQDTDTDLNSIGDGVPGFAGNWIYYDAMNGRSPEFECINAPLISIGFYNLPGEVSDPGDQFVSMYTADIDLGASGSFGTSLIFEIGDTDSDLQGAAVHNARMDLRFNGFPGVPDIDPDDDGLADWGWSLTFNQPGTVDVDNADGDSDPATGVDGDPLNYGTAGVVFGLASPGHPEYDSASDTWAWIYDGVNPGATEDLFNTGYIDSVTSGIVLEGPWWFGGMYCVVDPAPPGSVFVPPGSFAIVLYGPGDGCCPADLNCDGVIDFFDISFFLANSVDINDDTVFDFFDISTFLSLYAAGCP
ncbi:MAG: hypothetical protein JKY43_11865 [Phycisphaerales bacterium]|nr:hypothetical protein [Phycisphaerales bacterium]